MLTVNSTINLAGQAVPNIIPAVQGDTGRVIVFTLADFTIPAGSTATYYVQKPSGEAVYNSATIDSNKVTVELTAQSLAETGDNYGQVRILNGEDVVTSFDFILLVKPFRGIDAVESTTEMNIFDEAVQNAMEQFDSMLPDIIAPEFDSSTAYEAGSYVIYGGKLYQFTTDHAAGAWTGTDAEECTVTEKLGGGSGDGLTEDIKQALLQIAEKVAYIDEDGQDYYDGLYDALYPSAYLVSISAVYTQSGTVYDTDTLDSLKSDLVVTAHMSDHTTRTVTTYTLSGTLAEGTSTITVSYGRKTTTFDVTVTDLNALPLGYTKYDYIVNLNDAGDAANGIINTGINSTYCDTEYIHEIVMSINSLSGTNNGLYGCRNATGSAGAKNGNTLWANNTGKIAVGYNGVDSGYVLNFTWGEKHSLKLDTGKVYIDDAQVSTPTGTRTSYSTSAIRLFGIATNESAYSGIHGTMKLYSVKIKDSRTNEMIANLVPCTNPSNIPGVYDTIRQSFHYAVNYSNYTCGNDEV